MKKPPRFLYRLLCLTPLMFTSVLMADDTEIYFGQAPSANPNLLFVLDTSGSMSKELPDSGGKTRMQVMQEVLGEVMASAPPNLNVGLMRYGGHGEDEASGVSFPVSPIDTEAMPVIKSGIAPGLDNLPNPDDEKMPVREFLASVGNSWSADGYTPIVDSLYEAALYFQGKPVDFGDLDPASTRAAHPATYSTASCLSVATDTCNQSAGECTGKVVAGSCEKQWETVCSSWGKENEVLTNQCCGWSDVITAGKCCAWVASGYDEGGKATGWSCKNDDYSCSTTSSVCTNNDYSCTMTKEKAVCLADSAIEVEYCQQEQCESGKQYLSPMEYECQSNYIVLMSDGRPEYAGTDGSATPPKRKAAVETMTGTACETAPSGYASGACGPELTHFLATQDQSATLPGEQTVQTFTVAFALDDPDGVSYLQSLATVSGGGLAANSASELRQAFAGIVDKASAASMPFHTAMAEPAYGGNQPHLLALQENFMAHAAASDGDPLLTAWGMWQALTANRDFGREILGLLRPAAFSHLAAIAPGASGGFFSADDVGELTEAFNTILDKINASASSFSSPSYSVDKGSLLSHGDEVYLPVFESSRLPLWAGNLKKFKLKDGQLMGRAADGVTAIPALDGRGQFLDDAWDYWGASPSGAYVKGGGAASLLDPATRTLYTDAISTTLSGLDKTNPAISKALLGDPGMTDAYREQLLDFARGYQPDGTARRHMGDVMNSRPLVMDYGTGNSYVLVGSNEGFLHVFDAATGQEQWAFMPASLLGNIDMFYQNAIPQQHVYGVDGRLTLKLDDVNHDGKIRKADGDSAHVYFGMRRGGRAYYALDISDISTPQILWHIDASTAGFAELGESWSKPTLAQMRVHDTLSGTDVLKDVLVFGAGFDAAKEEADPTVRAADSMGRDVFIVDAASGALLWSLRADVSGAAARLTHSIPGDIRIMDMDRNGALDRLYFSDTGGNLWRVDMDMDVRDADSGFYDYRDARLTHLADLGGSGVDSRKFYYEPDVALMRDGGKTVMTISIGSGYRSRPLSDAIVDRFYVLLDEYVHEPPPLAHGALQDIDITATDVMALNGGSLLDGTHKGWSYTLPNAGEKVLAPAVTLLNKVIFTTFSTTSGVAADPCGAPPNEARAYVLDLFSGQAVANLDRSVDGSQDKSVVAGVNEILDAAQIVFKQPAAQDGSVCKAGDCQQGVEIRVGKMNLPVMDAGNSNAASSNIAESTDLSDILPRVFWNDLNLSTD